MLAMYDLAMQCFNTVSEQSMQFHSNRFSGSLVFQSNKFVGSFERLMDVIIWDLWPTLIYINHGCRYFSPAKYPGLQSA